MCRQMICKCGVDLDTDFCFCHEEQEQNEVISFSPKVLRMAMDLQKKIDNVSNRVGQDVSVDEMQVRVSYPLKGKYSWRLLGEEMPITCTTFLHSNMK